MNDSEEKSVKEVKDFNIKRTSRNSAPVGYSTFLMLAILYIIMLGMLKAVFVI